MLTELQIENFAIIENQSVQFSGGLNVITGETGSGKSIVLNALELILGGRSSTSYIRSGCQSLEVQAHFDLSTLDAATKEQLPDIARGDELVVQRTLQSSGKGKVYINGNLGTVSLLNEISARLITICSQSQQIRLLDSAHHLSLLDMYHHDHKAIARYQDLYTRWVEKKREVAAIEQKLSEREARVIFLEETIEELEALAPTSTLKGELEAQVRRLSSLQKLQDLYGEIDIALNGEQGVSGGIAAAVAAAGEMEKLDSEVCAIRELLQSAREEIVEADRELKRYISSLEADDDSFAEASERLTTLVRLERKHRTDTAGLCTLLDASKKELSLLGSEGGVAAIRKELTLLENALLEAGGDLGKVRRKHAKTLETLLVDELSELNMQGVQFSVSFSACEPTVRGLEKAEFLLAANKGESLKPLRAIASGGELSRITLVLKKILRDSSGVNVLVFDEVDTGISGAVARAVGEKLKTLSEQSQVICITHLPQVASLADTHLLVSKSTKDRTTTCVQSLSREERVDEVARMLSGFEVTRAAKDTARSLMRAAR